MLLRSVSIGLLSAFAIACGGSPTGPTLSVEGTWVGTNTNSLAPGSRPAQANIKQSGSTLSGTWSATTPGGPDGGSLSGSVAANNTLSMSFFSAVPQGSCHYEVTATVTGSQMTGTWTTVTCSTGANGTLVLTKQ